MNEPLDEALTRLAEAEAQVAALRAGFASEAYIIEVQALSVAPTRLGQKRHAIHTQQVERMRRVASGLEQPRTAGPVIWKRTAEALGIEATS